MWDVFCLFKAIAIVGYCCHYPFERSSWIRIFFSGKEYTNVKDGEEGNTGIKDEL